MKQAGHEWEKKLSQGLKEDGHTRTQADRRVWRTATPGKQSIVTVNTDDMLVAAENTATSAAFKSSLSDRYTVKDLGPVKWFLGFEVKRDRPNKTIAIRQTAYIEQLAERFGLENPRPISTPMESNLVLIPNDGKTASTKHPYRTLIGGLLWVAMVYRADIVFATITLAQFSSDPTDEHWEAAKRVLRYLVTTKELWLVLGGDNSSMEAYTDSDWASSYHRHSIGGYCFFMGDELVSWSSKKQRLIALSSTEAEYIAASEVTKEATWLRSLLLELDYPLQGPTTLFMDNQSAIALVTKDKFHGRTKHIDIKHHHIREAAESGVISPEYIPTKEQIADILTKALPKSSFEYLRGKLGIRTV